MKRIGGILHFSSSRIFLIFFDVEAAIRRSLLRMKSFSWFHMIIILLLVVFYGVRIQTYV